MSRAPIDSNHHKGLIVRESTIGDELDVTGADLTSANPLHVAVVDGTGAQITEFIPAAIPVLKAVIDTATNGSNQIVAAVTSKKIIVISATVVASGTVSVTWRSSATALSGPIPLVVNSGFVLSAGEPGKGGYFETAAGEALNLFLSAGIQVSGHISYYTE